MRCPLVVELKRGTPQLGPLLLCKSRLNWVTLRAQVDSAMACRNNAAGSAVSRGSTLMFQLRKAKVGGCRFRS